MQPLGGAKDPWESVASDTVPVGADAPPETVGATVTVQVVLWPVSTCAGGQFSALVVGAIVRAYAKCAAGDGGEVPAGELTLTGTIPEPGGLWTRSSVSVIGVTLVASMLPNLTAVAWARLVPMMRVSVPPAAGPASGLIWVTVGPRAAARYVKRAAFPGAEVPAGVATVTGTVPDPAGAVTCN